MAPDEGDEMGYGIRLGARVAALVLREDARTPYGDDPGRDSGREPTKDSAGNHAGDAAKDPMPADPFAPFTRDPDPGDIDAVETLGDEIALLAAYRHAAMYPYLMRIGGFDRVRGWIHAGHRTCAHWVSYRTGNDLGTSREHVRVARALEHLPEIGAAMTRGALSFSQVRALTRAATPENESDLLELAENATVAILERAIRAYKKACRLEEAEEALRRYEERTLSVFPNDRGGYTIHGDVDPETGVVIQCAIDAASDHIFRKTRPVPVPPEEAAREASRRRVDALRLVGYRALQAGFGADDPKTLSGTHSLRHQVMLFVEPETLRADGEPGMSELEDGTRVSAETARRLSCDCGVVRVTRDEDGTILNVGRKQRTISGALRRALEVRDRGCRFPGCGMRFTQGHHLIHWADGGETSLRNSALLCDHHHRLVHEGGWRVDWWSRRDRSLAFRDPRGNTHVARPPKPPELEKAPVESVIRAANGRGVELDALTAGARWRWEREVPDEVRFRATEAVLS